MIDFHALDHDTRTVALVGQFLQLWAVMEQALGGAIGAALELTHSSRFIMMANIGFLNKIYTLGAICRFSNLTTEDIDDAKNMLNQIQNLYGQRNIVAHTVFTKSDESDGVKFLAWRARGKLSFPPADWSISDFTICFDKMTEFMKGLLKLEYQLKHSKRIPANSLAALLAAAPYPPTGGFPGAVGLAAPFHPLQADHTSATSAANRETDSKTPPSLRE